jgi:hypothetical protein
VSAGEEWAALKLTPAELVRPGDAGAAATAPRPAPCAAAAAGPDDGAPRAPRRRAISRISLRVASLGPYPWGYWIRGWQPAAVASERSALAQVRRVAQQALQDPPKLATLTPEGKVGIGIRFH